MRWIYAYSCRDGWVSWERSFENIGLGPAEADRWLEEDPATRFLTIGMVIGGAYY